MIKAGRRPCVLNASPVATAKFRIFCFPYAGGCAAIFHAWRKMLSVDFDLWTIEYPGHGTRRLEPPLRDLRMLVDEITSEIIRYLAVPFGVFGHSMGALVGFEVLRRLQDIGAPCPEAFFASGSPAPRFPAEGVIYDLPEPEFIERLRMLNGTPEEVLADKELLRFVLPTLRADFQARQTYIYKTGQRLRCPIFAYGGSADPEVTRESLDPWRNETGVAFHMRIFPGDHFFVHTATEMLTEAISTDLFSSGANGVAYNAKACAPNRTS
jgi:medium-chain acyl-[acyl-carrier-protein] hydrolase